MVLMLLFVALVAAVHEDSPPTRKIRSLVGLCLAVVAAGVLLIDYVIQVTVMQPSLGKGQLDGWTMLTQYNPNGAFIRSLVTLPSLDGDLADPPSSPSNCGVASIGSSSTVASACIWCDDWFHVADGGLPTAASLRALADRFRGRDRGRMDRPARAARTRRRHRIRSARSRARGVGAAAALACRADPRNCRGRLVHRLVVVSGDLPAPRAARALASLVPSPGSLAHIAARPHCDRGSVRLRGRVSPRRQRLRDHCVCVRPCRPVSASGTPGGACSAPAAAGRSDCGHRARARPCRGGRGSPRRGGGRPHNPRRLRPYGVSDRARPVRGSHLGRMGTGDGDRGGGRPRRAGGEWHAARPARANAGRRHARRRLRRPRQSPIRRRDGAADRAPCGRRPTGADTAA